jgi:translocation and assembly module TamB
LEATLETGPLPVGVLAELAATPALREVQGVLDASVRVTGTAGAPRVLWNVSADRLSYRQWRNVDVFFSGESLPVGTHAELSLSRNGGRMATFAARIVPPADAAKTFPLKGLPVSERELLASHLEVDVDVPGLGLPGIAERSVEGYLQAVYENAGATVVSSFLLLEEGSSVGALNMSVAADLKALLADSQEAFADVKSNWKGVIATGSLEADIPDLATLKPVVESFGAPLESLSGKAMVRASLQGRLAKPFLGGRVLLENVDYVPVSGASIEDVTLDLILTEERIDIRNVSLNRGGVVRGSGGLTGLFPFDPKFTFEASTNDLRLLPLIAASPTLDAQVALEGALDKDGVLRSRVTINELRAYIPILQATKGRRAQALDAHPDVLLEKSGKPFTQPGRPAKKSGGTDGNAAQVAARGEGEQAKESNASSLLKEAHVDISMPNRAWVQGPDIQLELGTDMRVDWVDGIVSLEGQAGVVRPGFVQVLGKRFDVNTAQVVYANQDPARGALEAEATHVTDVATVFIDVTGPVAKPELVLRSEPELSQFEIASLIVTGKTTENFVAEQEGQEGEASTQDKVAAAAANAVANTLATQVLGAFVRNTDVILSIDFEDATNRKAKVGVGRYVTDKLFVSLDRNFGSEEEGGNGNEVRFDYRLSRRWSVEGNYGDGREGGVDLLWKRKF